MYATNEWSPLKKVIVGSATGARIPELDTSMRLINYADVDDISKINVGPYPDQVIEEANEDLEIFCDFLRAEDVEVLRPQNNTPVEYYDYCPRDVVFVHGKKAIATPMPIHARHKNYLNIKDHFDNLTVTYRSKENDLYNPGCVGNPNQLALTEVAASFDAANILRANDDILYLVSNSGNVQGAKYLQEQLPKTNVKMLQGVYSYMHIDSTVAFLREGLLLINPSRIKDVSQLPKPFCNWDYIICPEPQPIGHYGTYRNSSNWISMNLFSVNPNLVVVEEHQTSLQKELKKYNIECAMLPMRHAITLGGSFHCVTIDVERG